MPINHKEKAIVKKNKYILVFKAFFGRPAAHQPAPHEDCDKKYLQFLGQLLVTEDLSRKRDDRNISSGDNTTLITYSTLG